jgi:hypothetical protein
MYCSPHLSTSWESEINQHGPIKILDSEGNVSEHNNIHYLTEQGLMPLKVSQKDNPYLTAFWRWWPELYKKLEVFRMTGGEPLMSGHTWKLIDWFKTNQGRSRTKLAINSNLGFSQQKLQEFVAAVESLPHVEVYTSMEATGRQAEYIRDGLDYDQWLQNVHTLLKSGKIKALHVMCTINALCLDSLVQHLNLMLDLKRLYGRDAVNFTLNILRFPSFQSPLVLSDQLRDQYRVRLQEWLFKNRANPYLHEHEINHTQRLIDYLDVVKTPHSDAFDLPKLHNDFHKFYAQYDQRRDKDFARTFPTLTEWYSAL